MENLTLTAPENVLAALKKGERIAVFSINDGKKPKILLSEIKSEKIEKKEIFSERIAPAVKYIRANYNKDIKLETLSRLCDLSPSYLSRLFSQSYSSGINDYIIRLRLEQACNLLLTTRKTVVAIACDVGYVDCGYFNKLFKKRFGCTPLTYRKVSGLTEI